MLYNCMNQINCLEQKRNVAIRNATNVSKERSEYIDEPLELLIAETMIITNLNLEEQLCLQEKLY